MSDPISVTTAETVPVIVVDASGDVWKVWAIRGPAWPAGLSQVVCLSDPGKAAWAFNTAGPFTEYGPVGQATSSELLTRVIEELRG